MLWLCVWVSALDNQFLCFNSWMIRWLWGHGGVGLVSNYPEDTYLIREAIWLLACHRREYNFWFSLFSSSRWSGPLLVVPLSHTLSSQSGYHKKGPLHPNFCVIEHSSEHFQGYSIWSLCINAITAWPLKTQPHYGGLPSSSFSSLGLTSGYHLHGSDQNGQTVYTSPSSCYMVP